MPLKKVKYVTGNNRRRIEASIRHMKALLAYNAKQPAGSYLLPSQVTAVQTVIDMFEILLTSIRFA